MTRLQEWGLQAGKLPEAERTALVTRLLSTLPPVLPAVLVFAIALLLSGCGSIGSGFQANENRAKLLDLRVGDSRDVLKQKMGLPRKNEVYSSNGKVTEIWFYRTSHTSDLKELDEEFTPVVMIDDKVVGWGRSYYDNSIKIKNDITIRER